MRLEHWFYTVPLRLRSLFRSQQVEHELDEELQYHLERKIDEYIAQGLTPEQSRQAALRAMDGLTQRKDECRDMRQVNGIENTVQDIRYGLRILAKSPGFTAVAVLTLAVGIGANAAIFSVINAVLLDPLPYPAPDRIVQLMLFSPGWASGKNSNSISVPEFIVLREQRNAFQEIAAYDSGKVVNLTGSDPPEQLQAKHVTAGYFALFGARMQIGRAFTKAEDRPGGPRLAVISDGLWKRRFGGERGLVGKSLLLGDEPYLVIGVLGDDFPADASSEILLPLQADPYSTNPAHGLRSAARLKPGVTLDMSKNQLKLAHEQFRQKFPNWNSALGVTETFTAEPLRDATVGEVRRPLLLLAGAVCFVLLIACANVANLLMARATSRSREMAIRSALGASRQRIASQLLAESLLLSLTGGTFGILFGYAGVRALISLRPGEIPRLGHAVSLDWRVLAFTLVLSVCTGILFGILPAFTTGTQSQSGTTLALRTRGSVGQRRVRSILVVSEMALALVLLTGAGLLIRTFWALRTVDPGFDARNVLTLKMSLAGPSFQTAPAVAQMVRDAERRIESLPGVAALAATFSLPLQNQLGGPFGIEGLPNDRYAANFAYVSRRYFDVFRIPLLHGRTFTAQDDDKAGPVVLINQAMAEAKNEGMPWSSAPPWRKGDPLGERITIGKGMGSPFEDRTREIIGVVGEVRDAGLNRNPLPMMYIPIAQVTNAMARMSSRNLLITWTVRTRTDPYSLRANIERELRAASGGLPVGQIRSMEQVVADSTAQNRFNMILLSVFAGMAMLLGAIGIYGLMAYAVQHRTQEIGVRLALGARPQDVQRMVVLEGMRLAVMGVGLGVAGAAALTPLMSGLLYGVQASSPSVLTSVAALLTGVALLATYIPARTATRVDPVLALRWE